MPTATILIPLAVIVVIGLIIALWPKEYDESKYEHDCVDGNPREGIARKCEYCIDGYEV